MKNKIKSSYILLFVAAAIMIAAFTVIISQNKSSVIYIELGIFMLICVLSLGCIVIARKSIDKYFLSAAKHINGVDDSAMNQFGIAVMVVNKLDELVWYNERFRTMILGGEDSFGISDTFILNSEIKDELANSATASLNFKNRFYKVFSLKCSEKYEGQTMYFFDDETERVTINKKYENARPCVFFIHIDGLDLLLKNAPESKKNEILGSIEKEIEQIDANSKGYIQKISSDKYFLIMAKESYNKVFENKFSVLSAVRGLDFGDRGSTTLSIGVGLGGENLSDCVEYANAALDMALGRGGDQAVIKIKDSFEFFGGVSESKQINTAVRARLVSQTMKKLILGSDNVLIMGHSYSDMDAYGAAYALFCAITKLSKPANIVCNYRNTLAGSLLRYTARVQPNDEFILSPEDALPKIGRKTLLIVVDTHRAGFLESEDVLNKCESVIVIDHHRRNVDFIENSLLFYHDPSSSSTCEMVTELLRYFGTDCVDKSQANALLAGIMLDTKNLVLRTTARTFEASAFLREKGADPIMVKGFFSETIETYALKSRIVSSAKTVRNYAISFCTERSQSVRIAASQAADELLTISGVEASFVAFYSGDKINISARSFGKVNVQMVMEQLGGGGHQTMAAAQIDDVSFDECCDMITNAIAKAKEKE